ncbi:MAG TPA: PepSY-associated TM helix domain-containing protein [Gammaproteobacteria bacterium]
MKERLIQSMAWLHTWGGLLPGWLLFVIFFAGTLSCFDKEISQWMRPSTHAVAQNGGGFSFDRSLRLVEEIAPETSSIWLRAPMERDPLPIIGWNNAGQEFDYHYLQADGGTVLQNNTRGGDLFFRLHYRLDIPNDLGVFLVGFAGMCMLVALVTGVIIHRRIFKDFFTFRPKGSKQRAWLDAHNVSSVLPLPFHLVITYTGLVIFFLTYFPAGMHSAFGGDEEKFYKAAEGGFHREAGGRPAPLHALDPLVARAEQEWGDGQKALWVNIEHPGDSNAVVVVWRAQPKDEIAWISDAVYFDGVSGAVLHRLEPAGIGHHIEHFLSGLHFAQFGGQTIRWLYLFMGLSGCLMIASGMGFWIEKRRQRHVLSNAAAGFFLVRGLNAAAITGLIIASAVYLLSNRLLPAGVDHAAWELGLFYFSWIAASLHALARAKSQRLWTEQLWTAAILWGSIPLINLLTTDNSHLLATLPAGQWSLAGVDLMAILFGLSLGAVAWKLRHKKMHELESAGAGVLLAPRERQS